MDRPSPPLLETIRRVVEDPQTVQLPASWGRHLLGALTERDRSITRLEAEVDRLGRENIALRAERHS